MHKSQLRLWSSLSVKDDIHMHGQYVAYLRISYGHDLAWKGLRGGVIEKEIEVAWRRIG